MRHELVSACVFYAGVFGICCQRLHKYDDVMFVQGIERCSVWAQALCPLVIGRS